MSLIYTLFRNISITRPFSTFNLPKFSDTRNDVVFKKVFGEHENITRSFLNSTLQLKGERRIEQVMYLPTELLPLNSKAKKLILDILCTDKKGRQYIIELQNKSNDNYLNRIQFYACHRCTGQLKNATDYVEPMPVTILSILGRPIFSKHIDYLSFHENVERKTGTSCINHVSYVFVELSKFNKQLKELETEEDYWIYTIKGAEKLNEIPQNAPKDVKKAYEILEMHTWQAGDITAYENARLAAMDEVNELKTARNEGIKKGQYNLLVHQICCKFGSIPDKVSSMIKQLNEEQILALSERIFEAKFLEELFDGLNNKSGTQIVESSGLNQVFEKNSTS
jgi:predicted transposase/invertase (TIGR01784 family)